MGVPLDPDQLAESGVLSPDGLVRASTEVATEVADDVSVGDLVGARLGDEVVERLVEPLLGGVYAGHARRISAAAAAEGIGATAGTVTSAAFVMVAIFAVFATLRLLDMKQMGFGLAAAVQIARLNAAVSSLGTGMELNVIAAAVIGGTSFAGGVGTIVGALLGALIMQ